MTDLDRLLSRTAPSVSGAAEVGEAMGATARVIATASVRRRPYPGRRTGRFVLGAAAALVVGTVVVSGLHGSQPTPTIGVDASSQLRLLAARSAPSGLPLPDGVSMDDAKAFVATLVQANPGLQGWGAYVLDRGVLVAHETGQVANIPKRMQESGVTAAYVFYAQCQWKRTMLGTRLPSPLLLNGKPVSGKDVRGSVGETLSESTDNPGLAALMELGDPSSWSADGHRAPTQLPGVQPGFESLPNGPLNFDEDFKTNCTNGFGAAPTGNK